MRQPLAKAEVRGRAPASREGPPPPPPACDKGVVYEIVTEDEVAGQPTFDAAVKVDEWQEGVMVTLHFERDIHVTSARHASSHSR